jgi:5-methyltetrahydropteroyltriglutamate--homocysteine methyltransferase
MVGSWPRTRELLNAQRRKQLGRLESAEFEKLADEAVAVCVEAQVKAGVDIVTDGEQRRDNFYSFVTEKLDGTRLMTLAEMLDLVEDRAGFEELLQRLDVPSTAIKNPTCIGKLSRRSPLAVDEARFLRSITDRPIKIPLPGPYLLTRAMWVPEETGQFYDSKEHLSEDVIKILGQELHELAELGVDFVQFDEPVLTELVFTQGQTRTFMCAALAARKDPAEELEFAVDLMNQVVENAPTGMRVGMHVCRGNWSTREETLLKGHYRPLKPYLERMSVKQLVLEYATPRAGDLMGFEGKEIGLGVVNPRTPDVESVDEIVARIEEALQFWDKDSIFLNPDCGFATFSEREMNGHEIASRKMEAIAGAAMAMRSRF